MKVLVLGGSYFIGVTLVERLLRDGHQVSVLNRGSRPLAGTTQLIADRNDRHQLQTALSGREFDWVFDTSCYTPGQASMAAQALGGRYESWLYLSTAAVYPGGRPTPFGEDEVGPGREWEDYGRNKLEAEREFERVHHETDRRLIILRAPYVYGPRNSLPREWWLWARMRQDRRVWVPGDGMTRLAFVHVDDLIDAMCVTIAGSPAKRACYNVAQAETPTILEYLTILGEVAGVSPAMELVDYQGLGLEPRAFFPFRDFQCLVSPERLAIEHGWRARFTMREGLTQTWSTYSGEYLATVDTGLAVEHRLLASSRRD